MVDDRYYTFRAPDGGVEITKPVSKGLKSAIKKFPNPTNENELRRYLEKFMIPGAGWPYILLRWKKGEEAERFHRNEFTKLVQQLPYKMGLKGVVRKPEDASLGALYGDNWSGKKDEAHTLAKQKRETLRTSTFDNWFNDIYDNYPSDEKSVHKEDFRLFSKHFFDNKENWYCADDLKKLVDRRRVYLLANVGVKSGALIVEMRVGNRKRQLHWKFNESGQIPDKERTQKRRKKDKKKKMR